MSYDTEKLTKLEALKKFAERVNSDFATKTELSTLEGRIESAAEEANKIESIKVNGTSQQIAEDKSVDITVPTKVSELNNDEKFQKDTEVQASIQSAIAASGHAAFKTSESIPSPEDAQENILYLVKNADEEHYDIYAKVGSEVVMLDDTTVDLSEYSTTEQINTFLNEYVQKDGDKVLSEENFTSALKQKLDSIKIATNEEVESMLNEVFTAG